MSKIFAPDGTPASETDVKAVFISANNDSHIVAQLALDMLAKDAAAGELMCYVTPTQLELYVDKATELLAIAHLRKGLIWNRIAPGIIARIQEQGLAPVQPPTGSPLQ